MVTDDDQIMAIAIAALRLGSDQVGLDPRSGKVTVEGEVVGWFSDVEAAILLLDVLAATARKLPPRQELIERMREQGLRGPAPLREARRR